MKITYDLGNKRAVSIETSSLVRIEVLHDGRLHAGLNLTYQEAALIQASLTQLGVR